MKIFDKITQFYKENKPFTIYRKPNSDFVSGFFMNDDSLFYSDDFSESGFVFSPFDNQQKTILFPLEKSEFLSEKIVLNFELDPQKNISYDDNSKKSHIALVEKTIKEIHENNVKKIVVSREEQVEIIAFDLVEIYQKLLSNYKNAFTYVWFHPKVGLWLGATPETLLELENSNFRTMSLAGTQLFNKNVENVVWKNKELDEQQLVTDFIESQLESITSVLKIDKKSKIVLSSKKLSPLKVGDWCHNIQLLACIVKDIID